MQTTILKKALGAVLLATLLLSFSGPARALEQETGNQKSSMFYVVVPHPDDEGAGWSMITDHSDDYVVMVTMTRGEGTIFCRTPDESSHRPNKLVVEGHEAGTVDLQNATVVEGFQVGTGYRSGPFGYQGAASPVGEPNQGERHPLGYPWVGQGSEECKRARLASWHWFLDDMHERDGSTTSMEVEEDPWEDDDYQGIFCPPGHQGEGDGRPIATRVGCADVWADDQGARVAFDLGNGDPDYHFDDESGKWVAPDGEQLSFPAAAFEVEHVVAALTTLREDRASWGIPTLPEEGMLVAADAYSGEDQTCFPDAHPDHRIVQEALRFNDLGAGPQYGVARCPQHPFTQGAETVTLPADAAGTILVNLIDPVTEERLGEGVRNYGWVLGTYGFGMSSSFYWKVYN